MLPTLHNVPLHRELEDCLIRASIRALPAHRVVAAPSWRREMLRDIVPAFLLTRLFFILFTLAIPPWRVFAGLPALILFPATGTAFDAWNRWDARWYDDLARLGYNLRGPAGFKNVAFFPLFSLLTRTAHDAIADVARNVLGLTLPDPFYPPYLVAGMLVSNLCALAALAFFYGFVRLDYGRPAARRAATLLVLSPMSFYLFAAYSESTFLLCTIAFFYMLRLERWWQAGLWGLLAAASRPPGAVLVVPFVMAWAEAHPIVARAIVRWSHDAGRMIWASLPHRRRMRPVPAPAAVPIDFQAHQAVRLSWRPVMTGQSNDTVPLRKARYLRLLRPHHWPEDVRRALRNALPAMAIPLGIGLFMFFLFVVFGDPWWFSRAQQAWWRTFAPPWETLYASVAWPLGDVLRHKITIVDIYALHDLIYEVAGLVLTWLAWRRLPRAQGIYLWLVWIMLLSSPAMLIERRTGEPHHDVLMSLPRLLLMMFPLFTYLGLQRRLFVRLTVLFAGLLALYTGMFLTGGWVS